MIKLYFRSKIEKRYGQEVQKLCQMLGFGLLCKNQKDVNWGLLEMMVASAKETAPILTSMVLNIGLLSISTITSHFILIKFLAILVILYRSVHQNNSNYFSLLISIYVYSAKAKIDTKTLLNYLDLSILYNLLLKKLRNITYLSSAFIKEQALNYKFVGT